ncbi:MAG: magnesium-translocating P-type ATPase [Lachnospiraceae bacterium]|nr:magnesium-translocating P-type ATPase [Lachnospiraceae bacterium]
MGELKLKNSKIDIYAHVLWQNSLKDFHTSENGLSDEQVQESRTKYGANTMIDSKPDSILYRLRRAFVNPISIILFVLGIISFATEFIMDTDYSHNYSTAIIIFCMLSLSGIVRFAQEMKAKKVSDSLRNMVDTENTVRRDGEWVRIASSEVVVGDIIHLHAGDRVPAEVRIIKANDLFLSQSILTGESAILEKNEETLLEQNIYSFAGYKNIAFAGSAVIGGTGEGVVLAVGKDTVFGGIKDKTSDKRNSFDTGAASIAKVLIRFMCILVPIVFIATGVTQGDWATSLLFALSVGVGLTPELLPMVVNACLAKGSSSMGKKQTVVKNISAMQGFGSMDVLCVDKTGTLTGDQLILEYYMDILGNESSKVLDCSYLNSIYHSGEKNHLDEAILKCKEMPGKDSYYEKIKADTLKLDEIPFDYERKLVSVLVKQDGTNKILVKGSVDAVLKRCKYISFKDTVRLIDDQASESVHAVVDEMLDDGMKVLAVAYKEHEAETLEKQDEKDLILLGYLAFFDAPKESAKSAIKKLGNLNVKVKVLTGDEESVAISICRRLGIDTLNRMDGEEFDSLSEDDKLLAVERVSLFTNISPKQKSNIVSYLQENGHSVGFLGDGMNDLPAIVQSDVGISVCQASDVVKEASDVVLLKKDLNVLEEGILEGRKAFANTRKYIKITASSNFGNIFSIVIASIFLPFLPMTSLQLLLLNLLYDILCLVLPWDSVDEDIYRLPQEWSGKNLGRFMRYFGPISSVFDLITFAFLFFVICPSVSNGNSKEFIALFQTGWFLESMWTQVLILHLLRTKKIPFAQSKPAGSVITVTLIGVILFTVFACSPFGASFGLTIMPAKYFIFLIGVIIGYMALVSMVKSAFVKKYNELT